MKNRFHILAALLALIGLLGFTAGGAWAAACASRMEVAAPAPGQTVEAGTICFAGAEMTRFDGAGQSDGSDSGAPHCPYMPVGGGSACGVAALAPESSPEFEPSLPEAGLFLPTDDARVLLLAAHFFRPPIA